MLVAGWVHMILGKLRFLLGWDAIHAASPPLACSAGLQLFVGNAFILCRKMSFDAYSVYMEM